jgi:hypothetical protein
VTASLGGARQSWLGWEAHTLPAHWVVVPVPVVLCVGVHARSLQCGCSLLHEKPPTTIPQPIQKNPSWYVDSDGDDLVGWLLSARRRRRTRRTGRHWQRHWTSGTVEDGHERSADLRLRTWTSASDWDRMNPATLRCERQRRGGVRTALAYSRSRRCASRRAGIAIPQPSADMPLESERRRPKLFRNLSDRPARVLSLRSVLGPLSWLGSRHLRPMSNSCQRTVRFARLPTARVPSHME